MEFETMSYPEQSHRWRYRRAPIEARPRDQPLPRALSQVLDSDEYECDAEPELPEYAEIDYGTLRLVPTIEERDAVSAQISPLRPEVGPYDAELAGLVCVPREPTREEFEAAYLHTLLLHQTCWARWLAARQVLAP